MKNSEGSICSKELDEIWSDKIRNIRFIAIIIVVFGHSIIIYSSSWDLYTSINQAPLLDNIKRVIDVIQMPLFFSLSGYLFYYTHKKKRGIFHLIESKLKRLILPYFIVGLIYMVPIKLLIGYPGYAGKTAYYILQCFLKSDDVGHLWFLPALFLIFLIAEVILLILDKIIVRDELKALILLMFSLAFYYEGYRIAFGYSPLLSAFMYMIWFSVGYGICIFRELLLNLTEGKYSKIFKIAAMIVIAGALWSCAFRSISVIVSLICKTLCLLSIYILIPRKGNKITGSISNHSFGIYLLHSPLIYITFSMFPDINIAWVVIMNFFVYGGAALILTFMLKKANLGLLIGEWK